MKKIVQYIEKLKQMKRNICKALGFRCRRLDNDEML